MKPRTLFTIFLIAAFFIIIALPNYSQAVTFPKTYSGSALYRTTLTTSGTPFHCETNTKIEITLLADGKLIAQMGKMKISVSGPQCTLTPTEETSTLNGTHDLQGSFEITMAMATSKLIITGTYDDDSITGSVDNGTTYISFTLKAVKHPPQITLEPAKYSDFLANVLSGKGFTVKIRKEDGVMDDKGNWKLNFSTLVFATDGADNSLNFINTAANQRIITAVVDEKEIRFNIIPDPNKFMTDQNVFNIQKNGDHKIGLQICDTDGLCGISENTIYFGPFISVGSVTDLRCNGGGQQLDLERFFVGNMGYDSPKTQLYIALADLPNNFYMCYVSSFETWFENTSVLFMDEFPLPIGSVGKSG